MQCAAMQSCAVQYNTMQSTIQRDAIQCSATPYTAIHRDTIQYYNAVPCNAMQYREMRFRDWPPIKTDVNEIPANGDADHDWHWVRSA